MATIFVVWGSCLKSAMSGASGPATNTIVLLTPSAAALRRGGTATITTRTRAMPPRIFSSRARWGKRKRDMYSRCCTHRRTRNVVQEHDRAQTDGEPPERWEQGASRDGDENGVRQRARGVPAERGHGVEGPVAIQRLAEPDARCPGQVTLADGERP